MKIDYRKLNYKKIIIILTILLIVLTIGSIVKPLLYNSDEKGKIVEDEKIIVECQYTLKRYFNMLNSEDYDTLNKITPLLKNKSKKTYLEYSEKLKDKGESVVTKIMKLGSNIYSVKYCFAETSDINTVVIKIKDGHFFVYYDSNID